MKTNERIKTEMYGILNRWHESGLNQKDFCKSEGISYYKFKYWRTRQKKGATRPGVVKLPPPASKQNFIPITIPTGNNTFEGLKVSYPNGVTITCPPQTDETQLSTLIKLY